MGGLVVSVLRIVGETQEIKKQRGTLVFVDAPVEMRYERIRQRGRDLEAAISFEDFVSHEKIELDGLGGPDRPHLRAVEAISDLVIQNNGSEEEFVFALEQGLCLAA